MIQIKCGTCGTSQGFKNAKSGALSLPAAEEARLVSRGVAAYVTKPIISPAYNAGAPVAPAGGVEDSEASQDTPGADPGAEVATGGKEADQDEVARLERMQKVDLEQMAADMGVDVSGAKTKHDLAVLIAAAGEPDDGGTLPDLGAGDIVR